MLDARSIHASSFALRHDNMKVLIDIVHPDGTYETRPGQYTSQHHRVTFAWGGKRTISASLGTWRLGAYRFDAGVLPPRKDRVTTQTRGEGR